jgi:hypothetical protein
MYELGVARRTITVAALVLAFSVGARAQQVVEDQNRATGVTTYSVEGDKGVHPIDGKGIVRFCNLRVRPTIVTDGQQSQFVLSLDVQADGRVCEYFSFAALMVRADGANVNAPKTFDWNQNQPGIVTATLRIDSGEFHTLANAKEVNVNVVYPDGKRMIHSYQLSDSQLRDLKAIADKYDSMQQQASK